LHRRHGRRVLVLLLLLPQPLRFAFLFSHSPNGDGGGGGATIAPVGMDKVLGERWRDEIRRSETWDSSNCSSEPACEAIKCERNETGSRVKERRACSCRRWVVPLALYRLASRFARTDLGGGWWRWGNDRAGRDVPSLAPPNLVPPPLSQDFVHPDRRDRCPTATTRPPRPPTSDNCTPSSPLPAIRSRSSRTLSPRKPVRAPSFSFDESQVSLRRISSLHLSPRTLSIPTGAIPGREVEGRDSAERDLGLVERERGGGGRGKGLARGRDRMREQMKREREDELLPPAILHRRHGRRVLVLLLFLCTRHIFLKSTRRGIRQY
jgi:hypothetical protein